MRFWWKRRSTRGDGRDTFSDHRVLAGRWRGDRVSVPFNIACGTCRNCVAGWTSFCLRTNPADGVDGAAYGYAQMGPYQGGQAEYLRVPFADFNLLPLPPGRELERDFAMLSDIFPTGYHGGTPIPP